MPGYKVISNSTPFFRWANNTQKKLEGQVNAGFVISNGEPSGRNLIVHSTISGAPDPPPYVMSLSAVREIDTTPPSGDGLPDPIPAGKFLIKFNGITFVNDKDITWKRI